MSNYFNSSGLIWSHWGDWASAPGGTDLGMHFVLWDVFASWTKKKKKMTSHSWRAYQEDLSPNTNLASLSNPEIRITFVCAYPFYFSTKKGKKYLGRKNVHQPTPACVLGVKQQSPYDMQERRKNIPYITLNCPPRFTWFHYCLHLEENNWKGPVWRSQSSFFTSILCLHIMALIPPLG